MKLRKNASGKNVLVFSKKELDKIVSQIIPGDGFSDGGEAYTDSEMDIMDRQSGDITGFMERWVAKNNQAIREIGEFAKGLSEENRENLKNMLSDVVTDYVYTNSRQDYDPKNYQRPPMS